MLLDGLHQPLTEAATAMALFDVVVQDESKRGAVGDDACEADLSFLFVQTEIQRATNSALQRCAADSLRFPAGPARKEPMNRINIQPMQVRADDKATVALFKRFRLANGFWLRGHVCLLLPVTLMDPALRCMLSLDSH